MVIAVAGKHVTTIMPGYTALQHGQPWTMGHYLSGWANALERDFDRLQAAYGRTNQSSLGASALAGSSWPLNRTRTASLLAFDGVLANSRDAGFGNKDYVAEILAAVGILMTNLSTLAADLHLWSTFEFNMIEVADGFCGTSSLMPQKKNAWAVDWIRGAAGNSIGNFASCLGAMRGSSSTDASLQDYPETALPGALGDAIDFLPLLQGVIETMNVNEDLMLERAWSNWTTASNLADAIVRLGGLSFRSAHGIVGRLVRDATASGLGPRGVTPEMLDKAAMEVAGARVGMSRDTIMEALNPLSFIESRVTLGSVNPKEVVLMLKDAGNALREDQDWMLGAQKRIADAETELSVCVNRWMAA